MQAAQRLGPDVVDGAIATNLSNKNLFLALLPHLGISDVPRTMFFNFKDVALRQINVLPRVAYVKLAEPSEHPERGVWRCASHAALRMCIEALPSNVAFQVQEELDITMLLDALYEIKDGKARRVGTVEILGIKLGKRDCQLHEGSEHERVMNPLARAVGVRGVAGYVSFRVAVIPDMELPSYRVLSCTVGLRGTTRKMLDCMKDGDRYWRVPEFELVNYR